MNILITGADALDIACIGLGILIAFVSAAAFWVVLLDYMGDT